MKKKSFFIGASILAIGGFLAKFLGAFYKIPLTHILGANGMGVYYLVFPFYSLALILASSGISTAVTKMVATERSKFNKRNEQKIFKLAILCSFIVSLILVGLTYLLADTFSFLQGNNNAYLSYLAIAPAIVFASVLAVIKGYFQGVENMLPSSISLLVQQTFKLLFGLFFAYKLKDLGVQYAVLGAIIGVTLSELVTLIYLTIRFVVYRRKQFYKFYEKKPCEKHDEIHRLKREYLSKNTAVLYCNNSRRQRIKKRLRCDKYYCENNDCCSYKTLFVKLIKYAIPSTLSSLVLPLSVFVDSFLVVNLLTNSGYSTTIATSLYGMSNGIVSSLISLPIVVISAMSTTIVPNLSSTIELSSQDVVVTKTNFFIKFAWIIALPMCALYLIFSSEIINVLYAGGLSSKVIDEFAFSYKILALSSISIIYNAFLYTFTAILNAFDKPEVPFYSQIIALAVRTLLAVVLVSIPALNVFGLIIANTVFLLISCVGCVLSLRKVIPLRVNFKTFFVTPIVSIILVSVLGYGIKQLCYSVLPSWLVMVIVGGVMMTMYILLLFVLRAFNTREWAYLPIPKKLVKFLPKKFRKYIQPEDQVI